MSFATLSQVDRAVELWLERSYKVPAAEQKSIRMQGYRLQQKINQFIDKMPYGPASLAADSFYRVRNRIVEMTSQAKEPQPSIVRLFLSLFF